MNPSTSHQIKHREVPKDVFYTPVAVAKTHIASAAGPVTVLVAKDRVHDHQPVAGMRQDP